MRLHRSIGLGIFAAALVASSMIPAGAQEPADHSAHHPDQQAQQTTAQTQPNPQMQMMGGCPNTGNMMGQGMQGMMGSGMMGPGMMQGGMGPGMMQGGMGAGMMQGGMTPMQGGMGAIFGSRVTPMMSLSIDDVRGYLAVQLDRLNNKRLKVGDVRSDDGTITADIVTVDNSLVQRLKVDRHTGAIDYQD
jgi:hypothetical protein